MEIEKRIISSLNMPYSTAELSLSGKRFLVTASEAIGEHAYIIDPLTWTVSDLWMGDTGVMNIIQIPDTDKLLAITKFYPVFQSCDAEVCLIEPTEKGYMHPWNIKPILRLPFCHRIGILKNSNGLFLIGCQLCHDKEYQDDWKQPGSIWISEIPEAGHGEWKWHELFSGLTKNHGLFIEKENQIYICAENGVLHFDLSDYFPGNYCTPELVIDAPSSDIWITEKDNKRTAVTIEPFHGNTLSVYQIGDKQYNKFSSYEIDFGHVAWTGDIFGKLYAIAGSRGGEKQLELIDLESGERKVIDEEVGPTQISVFEQDDCTFIFSANHGAGDVSIYKISDEKMYTELR